MGITPAPRLVLSGRPMAIIGGHLRYFGVQATGENECRAAVRQLIKEGADFIKITATGGSTRTSYPSRPSFSVEELSAICDEAHRFGKHTAAHCASSQGIVNALDAGVDTIILLTDGENNIDTITPRVAGMMAQELGIKVYTIFVGPTIARYPGGLIQRVQTADLEQVAENTGARFFHAEDATQLDEVYKEIESLERRPREEERHADSYDLYPRLLLPALLLYVLAGLSSFTWARRLP